MKYKIVIFDLDGTLLDTLQDLADSTNFALSSFGYPKRSVAEVRRFVGNGVEKLIERALPEGASPADIKRALDVFKAHYAEHCEDHTAPYAGITLLLDRLTEAGVPIAVVSNKIDSAVQTLCKKYFGERIPIAIGERDGIRKKPYPDSVLEVLSKTGISPADAVYVGDSEVDILTARNAGTDVICVTWGFRDQDFLSASGGFIFADSAEQLEQMLMG
ncbi:MAG: HAD-IA family hydrolase [Clostridia bacterium]|nr:HAD-IA family hydrolase [Clostridia bacterium]